MALRGKKPTEVTKRLKCLFYGPAGAGKTTAAIQMPRPYLIDTEKGAENDQYVKLLNKAGGAYFPTNDADELISEVRSLISEKHNYATLIIDPLTVIYNDLLDKAADKVGTDFGKHKGPANRKIKHLLNLLLMVDLNVVITSHAKPNWVRAKDAAGKDTVATDGLTFDCYGSLDYLFDLVIEVGRRGKERVGTVRKTRLEGFPEGEVFPFSYSEIATRYGKDVLERDAVPVQFASAEQVAELNNLIGLRKDGEELADKWLTKAKAETFAEMPADAVSKCIDYLKGQQANTQKGAAA